MNVPLVTLLIYFVLLLGIGIWSMRLGAGRDLEGYLLGGRRVGPAVTALTLQSTSMSGYMFLGAGSLAYTHGYWGMWYALGDIGGGVLNLSVLGRRMRKLSQILGAVTSIEYLERRFPSAWTRLIAAPIALFCLFFYVLAQFIAGGKGLELVAGIPYPVALLVAIGVIVGYTFMGGYLAVAYTDFIQAIIMLVGVLWILFAALFAVGGLSSAHSRIAEIDPSLLTMWGRDLVYEGQWGLVVGALLIFSLGYMGWPHVVTRHMAMRKTTVARRAAGYSTAFNLLFVPAPYLVGILALLIVPTVSDPEMAIFETARELLPAFVLGLVMAAIMAAIMSTVDSLLLQTGTIAARDIYHRFINPKMDERTMVWISRGIIVLIAAVAYPIAVVEPPAVFDIVIFATSVLGTAFAPCFIAAVWWPRANTVGAIASMLSGTAVTVFWELADMAAHTGMEAMLVGIIASTVAMVLGSLLSQKASPVPPHIRRALDETRTLGPIPKDLLREQDARLAGEAEDARDYLDGDTPRPGTP